MFRYRLPISVVLILSMLLFAGLVACGEAATAVPTAAPTATTAPEPTAAPTEAPTAMMEEEPADETEHEEGFRHDDAGGQR